MISTRKNKFYALYDNADKCLGVYDNINELVNFGLMSQNLTKRAFEQMCSRYKKLYGEEPIKITEDDKTYCSQKVYEYKNSGYSVYKFWEENIA